jgi:DNA mismatch repair protein MutL
LTARQKGEDAAVRLTVRGGEIEKRSEVGAPVGCTFDVRDIFFNTPARLKFMRSPATEQAHIADTCLRVMLGARRVGLDLKANGRTLLRIPADGSGSARALAALGKRVDGVFDFHQVTDSISVSGFLTRPELSRGDSKGLWLYVNRRFVRDRTLSRAVVDAYASQMAHGRYPTAIVYVDMAPEAVDVNVHPQKTEVRFADARSVYHAVLRALAGALMRAPWAQAHGFGARPAVRGGPPCRPWTHA